MLTKDILFNDLAQVSITQLLENKSYSTIFVLVDANTKELCLPKLQAILSIPVHILEIPFGEEHKNIKTCNILWNALSNAGADRKSVLLNLGGGVITDLGGFVAATFKRGIDFINIPTTLLAMVDAAIGGKTGVDMGSLKNQIGVIQEPEMVLIFTDFLKTLAEDQLNSGSAEMLKHGLVQDEAYWDELRKTTNYADEVLIRKSVEIKTGVVNQDINESGLRKILNFGHTLGHAIESYFLEKKGHRTLLHGEAIAIGIVLEAYISNQLTGLSKLLLDEIKTTFLSRFEKITITPEDIEVILELLRYDKKNSHGKINFVLLPTIGKAKADLQVPEELFLPAFAYYSE